MYDPVNSGVVANLRAPGGNLTGVRDGAPGNVPERLEWLMTTKPDIDHIFLVHNPRIASSDQSLADLRDAAKSANIDLLVREIDDAEGLILELEAIPSEADAIFVLHSGSYDG